MCKITTSKDRGCKPPYKCQVAPPRCRGGELDLEEWLETLNWPYLTVIKEPTGLNEIIMEGHKSFQNNSSRGRYSG